MEVFDFGLQLQQLRKAKKLSQSTVAKILKTHPSTISSYERNIITPSVENMVRLAKLYGVSIDYMIGFTDRSNIYIDDLDLEEQKIILWLVETLICYFKSKK